MLPIVYRTNAVLPDDTLDVARQYTSALMTSLVAIIWKVCGSIAWGNRSVKPLEVA